MSEHPIKAHPTLGCCGLDCGLCPRYYTVGSSRCPGCCGPDFFSKHPSCSYITCCVRKRRLEVCAQCGEFPCTKFESWLADGGRYDSFLTHKRAYFNMDLIKKDGLEKFVELQGKRIQLLERMIKGFDDGRSRSFYCIAATLLSLRGLEEAMEIAEQRTMKDETRTEDIKAGSKILRGLLDELALREGVELRLRKKTDSDDGG